MFLYSLHPYYLGRLRARDYVGGVVCAIERTYLFGFVIPSRQRGGVGPMRKHLLSSSLILLRHIYFVLSTRR
jgi:hypothetical protein